MQNSATLAARCQATYDACERMKKSASVTLGILATAACLLSACNRNSEMQRCVGPDDMVVEDRNCESPPSTAHPGFYHWYYGGRGGYDIGSRASGGGLSPSPGMSSVRGSSVSRGGFGHFFSGHSSGAHGAGE